VFDHVAELAEALLAGGGVWRCMILAHEAQFEPLVNKITLLVLPVSIQFDRTEANQSARQFFWEQRSISSPGCGITYSCHIELLQPGVLFESRT
jgi:hypothetical protein